MSSEEASQGLLPRSRGSQEDEGRSSGLPVEQVGKGRRKNKVSNGPRASSPQDSGSKADDTPSDNVRWECRIVTPIVGAGVDCCQGEGCGLVVCEQPFSFFGNLCCTVQGPPRAPETVLKITTVRNAQRRPAPLPLKKRASTAQHVPGRSPKIIASPSSDDTTAEQPSDPKGGIRIFVGTWNTEYQQFPPEYIAALQERLSSLPRARRCYTAQQLYAVYTRHVPGSAPGGIAAEDGDHEHPSSEVQLASQDGSPTSLTNSSGVSGISTTTASVEGVGDDTGKAEGSSTLVGESEALIDDLEMPGEVPRESAGESGAPSDCHEIPGGAPWKSAAVKNLAAAAVGGIAAAGGAAAAAARAAAAAGAALSAVQPAGKGCEDTEKDLQDADVDVEKEEAGEQDEGKKRAIDKLFVLSASGQQPLADWLKPGYDVYVITLQEVVSASTDIRKHMWSCPTNFSLNNS